jgi:DNA polymerase III subunit beta
MELSTNIQKLKTAIIQADKITSKNASHPILGAILLKTVEKGLNIRSTNLSLGVDITVPANIKKEGEIAVVGSLLVGIFSSLSGKEEVSFNLVGDTLSVSSAGSNLVVNTLATDEFPSIPKVEGLMFKISTSLFLQGLKAVYYAASVSDIKPEISSVFIYPENNNSITFVSTDTFRLAEKSIKVDSVPDFNGLLIPFKNISEIIRVLADHEDSDVEIIFNKNQISFQVEDIYLTSRLIDGLFPDYRQILPKDNQTQVIVLKQDLIDALRMANVFGDKFNQATIVIDPSDGIFEISSKNAGVGENNTTLDATLTGDSISLNINYKYLLDCFQSIHDDSVVLEFVNPKKPMIVKSVSDKTFLYLIMPMNR